ncbi:hypothetical protein LIER_40270 [Lithospermum erythrorhizon]|uniref:Uncharacterized protein n=1 Tax=Lithospermum erythrorhizon TaxID=34254 RepID=A0AAV3QS34_LITER
MNNPTEKALPPPPPLPPPPRPPLPPKSSRPPPQRKESPTPPLPPLPPPPQAILYVKSFLEDFSYTNEDDRRLPVPDPESLTWYTLLKMKNERFTMVEDVYGPRYNSNF